jgi:predicted dithiol-disulfide oxidoreductase (DUF899 family)
MPTRHVEYPRVVSRPEWLSARREFLLKEKEFTWLRDRASAERRRLHVQFRGTPGNWLMEVSR